jgi:hypothetical protein
MIIQELVGMTNPWAALTPYIDHTNTNGQHKLRTGAAVFKP